MLERVNIDKPKMGYKGWLINKKGMFLFEEEQSVLHTLTCTAGGSGGFAVYDGIPDENGYFPEAHLPVLDPGNDRRNGRCILEANPATLGSWMFDIALYHGLAVQAEGGNGSAITFATVTWDKLQNEAAANKSYLWNKKGTQVLEKGPTDFRGIAITHAGAGSLVVFDGIPDKNGFFPDEQMKQDDPLYNMRNGRPIFEAHPPVVQMWFPGAGCYHGLTVRCMGGHGDSPPTATVIWKPTPIRTK